MTVSATFCALLILTTVYGINGMSMVNREDSSVEDATPRRISKRQVKTIYHYPAVSSRNMGLDPHEERLLIALLGGCIAIVFALVFLVICCRTYRFDRNVKNGAGGAAGGGGVWGAQQMMLAAGQGGRPMYYPTGYQPSVAMDPAYLDPGKSGVGAGAGLSFVGQQQQQQQQQHVVDNTAYASLGAFDRPQSQPRM